MQKTTVQGTEAQKKDEEDIGDSDPAYGDCLLALRRRPEQTDAVVIGVGSGLSAAIGLAYTGRRFEDHFREFTERHDMKDMYSAGLYPFPIQEEKWTYWSRRTYYNKYDMPVVELCRDLYAMMKDKNHFVLTANVSHWFWLTGFRSGYTLTTQGNHEPFQRKQAYHKRLCNNETQTRAMLREQKDCRIPSCQVLRCPACGGGMEVHLGCGGSFVEDEAWYWAAVRYETFLRNNQEKTLVFLELGVGMNAPGIIKYPFRRMAKQWRQAFYISVNLEQAWMPDGITDQSLVLRADIVHVLKHLTGTDAECNDGTSRGERSYQP